MSEIFPPLVDTAFLARALPRTDAVVIDIRTGAGAADTFASGHIPGAVHSDYALDGWRRREGNVPGLLPTEDHLQSLFGRLGLTPDRQAVIVAAGNNASDAAAAARVYWTLKICGHGPVSLLDGGMRAWCADPARPLATAPSGPRTEASYPVVFRDGLRSDLDATLAASALHCAYLVDARALSYFVGKEKSGDAQRAGRLPGAISRDYAAAVNASTGLLKPLAELASLYAAIPAGPVVNYCNTGHTAALNWFVLSELLGRKDVALFDGSMSQWTEDPHRPVVTGT